MGEASRCGRWSTAPELISATKGRAEARPSIETLVTMRAMRHVGVDGCKGGWIAVTSEAGALQYRVFSTARTLSESYTDAERIFIDIPIGLPWHACPIRPCDRLARLRLGARRSSVFPVPCRAAAYADSIERAKQFNIHELGRSLSQQTWEISHKIEEIDRLFLGGDAVNRNIWEVHPEVCFWALAEGQAMRYRKRSAEGIVERVEVLSQFEPGTQWLLDRILKEQRRETVGVDDILDALVAFITASAPLNQLKHLSGDPTNDEKGIPMQMVYWSRSEVTNGPQPCLAGGAP